MSPSVAAPTMTFRNEPLLDFSEESARTSIRNALQRFDLTLKSGPIIVSPIIAGAPHSGGTTAVRLDPSDTSVVVGRIGMATEEEAESAIATCHAGAEAWARTPAEARIRCVRTVASIMRDRRAELTAVIIREVGKPWREADGDVAEAIDFCDYYAACMESMASPRLTDRVLGEENTYFYQPRGVAGVISPWNFPLAIMCGMTVAALVTGNTVVMKPAEQSSVIAALFAQIVLESGIPGTAFAFLPGQGETIGRMIVEDPRVDMIAFTGSREVGFQIIQSAARVLPGQRSIKRVIAELGGKNAIIVDEDADMDDAVRGILYSAFGFAGQKCSACSRVIAVGSAYEPLLARLALATEDLIIAGAQDPAAFIGPVVDGESCSRIADVIESASNELTPLVRCTLPPALVGRGHFVAPAIFRDVPVDHSLWTNEVFGPVVACRRAESFDEALQLATASSYALTGGVYSRHPEHLSRARREFKVGNLYINRGITGALVGRQPFGGFKYSGIGSKAGGPDYLLQFVEPRVVSENTMRRGFTPDLG